MARSPLADEITLVAALCDDLGLGEVTPALLKAAHHTTFLLSPLAGVARVQSSEPLDVARTLAIREIAVTRHLTARGAPALGPLDRIAGPHVAGTTVVTLWPFLARMRNASDDDAALAANSLAAVHRALLDFDGTLPPYTEGLDHCREVLNAGDSCPALLDDDRDVLTAQFNRLRADVEAKAGDWISLHGDAHPGNLLIGESGPVWVDFEDACRGPPEYDIACLPRAAWSGFADADQGLIRQCADLRTVCVAIWCWADPSRSDAVREAAEYHLLRVRDLAERSQPADGQVGQFAPRKESRRGGRPSTGS